MVLLTSILRLELSDLPGTLVLLEDNAGCVGASMLLWTGMLARLRMGQVIVTDQVSRKGIINPALEVLDLSIENRPVDQWVSKTPGTIVFIDSLDLLSLFLGDTAVQSLLRSLHNSGVCCVAQTNFGLSNFAKHDAGIRVLIKSWNGCEGLAECIHRRGYTKVTREMCSFRLENAELIAVKAQKTAQLPVPKPVVTPVKGLIVIDDEDAISPDEEGDEDDAI